MNYANLKIIAQPAWKIVIVDFVARILGILVKVNGIPVGSARNIQRNLSGDMSHGAIIGGGQ